MFPKFLEGGLSKFFWKKSFGWFLVEVFGELIF